MVSKDCRLQSHRTQNPSGFHEGDSGRTDNLGKVKQTRNVGGEFTTKDTRANSYSYQKHQEDLFSNVYVEGTELGYFQRFNWSQCLACLHLHCKGILLISHPTLHASAHLLDFTCAVSLCLTFLFFFKCVFKCQSGKSPGFMPGAEGSLPCDPQEEGVSGRVGWKQIHQN